MPIAYNYCLNLSVSRVIRSNRITMNIHASMPCTVTIYIYKEFTLVQVAIGQSIYFTAQGLYVLWMLSCKINLECLIIGKGASHFTRKKRSFQPHNYNARMGGGGRLT